MALDPQLLEILACPEDKGPLLYFADESSLYNPRLKRRKARLTVRRLHVEQRERFLAQVEQVHVTPQLPQVLGHVRNNHTRDRRGVGAAHHRKYPQFFFRHKIFAAMKQP